MSHSSGALTPTSSSNGELDKSSDDYFAPIVKAIMDKLRNDLSSITTEDARRLSENAVVGDLRTAKIISAVEAYATANELLHEIDPRLGQAPHTSLLTVVNDLSVAVDQNPNDVTTEVLKSTQAIVSKMQKAVGHTNAPNPELELQLQEEIAKIEPKVAEGTVTIEEANHLHSLEARAHGHTEKGGITSIAQSVAAKRERQLSLSSGSTPAPRSRANSSYSSPPPEYSHRDRASSLREVHTAVKPNDEQGTATAGGASVWHSREAHADSQTERSGSTPLARSFVSQKHEVSLTDQTNTSPQASMDEYMHRKEPSGDVGAKLSQMSLHKRENSLPIAQVEKRE